MTNSDELCWLPAAEPAHRIRNGEVTPVDVAEQVSARIEAVNPEVNVYINFLGKTNTIESGYHCGSTGRPPVRPDT